MVDPISNAPNLHEIGANQVRPQASPSLPGALNPATNLAPDQRVEELPAAVEKLIRNGMPANTKLEVVQDKDTGTFIYRSVDPQTGEVVRQYPPEELLKLRKYLKDMEGLLFDTQA